MRLNQFPLRMIIFLFLMSLTNFSWSAYISIDGEGRFTSTNEDTQQFIKQQLMFKAIADIYNKELKNLGLDSQLFWQRFDEKFESYFSSVITSMRESAKLEGQATNPEFEKKLRQKRLNLYAKFGRLERALVGFSERRSGKVSGSSNTRFLLISAKVDQKMLNSIYYRFTVDQSERKFSQMFISFEPKLANCSWSDIGVENPADFVKAVEDHWLKQIQGELGDQVEKIEFVAAKDLTEINNYLKTNFALKNSEAVASNKFQSAVLMTIHVQITKNFDEVNDQEREFSFEGYFLITDLTSSKVIQHFDFPLQKSRLSYAEGQQLGSNVASIIAKLPSVEWNQSKKLLANSVRYNGVLQLSVDRIANVFQYLTFVEFIQSRLAGFRPKIAHNIYNGDKAIIDIWFEGDQEKFKQAVSALNQVKVTDNVWAAIPNTENPLNISLVSKIESERSQQEATKTE